MSQSCNLVIYEPRKEPRTVPLCINPADCENIRRPVFSEDGTLLKNYRVAPEMLESVPKECTNTPWGLCNLIKSLKKSITQGNVAKSKEGSSTDIVPGGCVATSAVPDIQVSETTQLFLSQCEKNSVKKEKKIARIKEIKKTLALKKSAKKSKKKRKKCKNRIKNGLFNELFVSGGQFESFMNSIIGANGSGRHSVRNDLLNPITNVTKTASQSKRKRKKKKTKAHNADIRNEKEARVDNLEIRDVGIEDSGPENFKTTQKKSELNDASKTSVPGGSLANAGVRLWNPKESAPDFIPMNVDSRKEPAPDFIPMNFGSSNRYSSNNSLLIDRRPNYGRKHVSFKSRSKPFEADEFIGISQKAFFLQC